MKFVLGAPAVHAFIKTTSVRITHGLKGACGHCESIGSVAFEMAHAYDVELLLNMQVLGCLVCNLQLYESVHVLQNLLLSIVCEMFTLATNHSYSICACL
jgi:hypothetical protein